MSSEEAPRKIELVFFRNEVGREPVREWLKSLDVGDRRAIGTDLPRNRTSRILICLYERRLVALHGFIKKTRATPVDDLTLARTRQKELER